MKRLISIIGPTAIGKTALSLQLARHFDCEIVSCDSRQFFREMTIGTAVPEPEERAVAPHHFIHNQSIFDHYSVGDFEKEALETLSHLFQTRDYAVLVGGSGLYVEAVLNGLDRFPEVPKAIRQEVREHYESKGIGYLQQALQTLDPVYFGAVDSQNPQRLMRAVEVCLAAGHPYSDFRTKKETKRNFEAVVIGLEAPRDVMYDRINRRVDLMMEKGLLSEARKLYPHRQLNALQTVGYRELFRYLDGEIALEQAIEDIKMNTRRFAKRQLTWFRRTKNATWFDYRTDPAKIAQFVEKLPEPPQM